MRRRRGRALKRRYGRSSDPLARLRRGVAKLKAVRLDDGRYAHYDDGMNRWYVVDANDVDGYCDYLDSDDPHVAQDAYSHWCAGTMAEEMPKGWEPS
jgi:hypothetical protein